MKLVEFPFSDGRTFWINPEQVRSIVPNIDHHGRPVASQDGPETVVISLVGDPRFGAFIVPGTAAQIAHTLTGNLIPMPKSGEDSEDR